MKSLFYGLLCCVLGYPQVPLAADHVASAAVFSPSPGALADGVSDGVHRSSRSEWWHLTGHLKDSTGHEFDYQLSFFRFALPHRTMSRTSEAWDAPNFYHAVLAITNEDTRGFSVVDRLARQSLGIAGASESGLSVHLDNWRLEGEPLGRGRYLRATATNGLTGIDLMSTADKARVAHGASGILRTGPCSSCSSRYYSYTRLRTSGKLTFNGATLAVSGLSWMDHQFDAELPADVVGWDWFGFQFNDGREVMLYLFRREDGSYSAESSGTLVDRDGKTTHLTASVFHVSIRGGARWMSPHSAVAYPAFWDVKLPSLGTFSVRGVALDQEVVPSAGGEPYWKGAVELQDEATGGEQIGVGFVELTGYAAPVHLSPTKMRNAIATAYRLYLPRSYTFKANVQLSQIQGNHDFSAAWLMVIANRGPESLIAPFLQVGIIRDARRQFRLQTFVADQLFQQPLKYVEGSFIPDGWHDIEIKRQQGVIRLFVDGKQVFSAEEDRFFRADDVLYLQIGSELNAPGDTIDAEWQHFHETVNGSSSDPNLQCFADGRGLAIVPTDSIRDRTFQVHGMFDPSKVTVVHGNCKL